MHTRATLLNLAMAALVVATLQRDPSPLDWLEATLQSITAEPATLVVLTC